jgi:hypothetical protein
MKQFLLAAVAIVCTCGCDVRHEFRFEPENRKTFSSGQPLQGGDVVWLRIVGLEADQRLRLHKCGQRCNSAQTIEMWGRSQVPPDGRIGARIPSVGQYYFWVEEFDDSDPSSGKALTVRSTSKTSAGRSFQYTRSLVITVEGVQSSN